MNTMYRIFVKHAQPTVDKRGIVQDVVTSVDVKAQDVYATMRKLKAEYPGKRIASKQLNPLGL